ncbi:MAG: hypothetical protein H6709_09920 [Kofleriaceae bacterium]|nr:hypothetical protein [Myxococcales bacterium]MCB9565247.1 hypothetical protein [Kofleriaceae bacterium]MCB9572390.1 hypothetical protein [Kofleriaceae bacterium]
MPDRDHVHTPADSRRRGLPAIGFRLRAPAAVALEVPADGPVLLRAEERGGDDGVVGALEVTACDASLIIDRDGVLEELASDAADRVLAHPAVGRLSSIVPVELAGGPTGFRADVDLSRDARGVRPELPCLALYALASPDLAVSGALIVVVRSVTTEWPAAAAMMASLKVLSQRGGAGYGGAGHDDGGDDTVRLRLPVPRRR